MITRLKLSTIEQGLPKYRSMLAGNDAYVPPAFESIATATVTSAGSQITFTSIPSTYQHLQLRYLVRDDFNSTATTDLIIWLQNSFTANYAYHTLSGNGSSASASATTGSGSMYFTGVVPNKAQNGWGVGVIDIHDYAVANKNRVVRLFGGLDNNGSGIAMLASGLRPDTTAISRIDISTGGNGFQVGSTIALYGIKG